MSVVKTITVDKGLVQSGTAGTVDTADITADAVTYAKMQNVSAASKLLGRGSASGAGDVEEITLGTGLSMSGTTVSVSNGVSDGDKGDVTVSSSGATWTIDNDAVTYAKIQNVSAASRLLGRGSASGSGDCQEITLGTGLSMSGTTLSSSAAISDGDKGDITVSSSGATWTIDNDAVSYAKIQNVSAASRLLGRGSASGSGDCEELTVANGLLISTTVLQAYSATTSQVGVVVMANQSDMETGTTTDRAVTPAVVKHHPGVCKGWVTFNGTGTPAAAASYNYTSITDNGTGDYTIAWDVDFSAHTYVALCSATAPGPGGSARFPCLDNTSVGSTRLYYGEVDSSGTYVAADRDEICLAVFGDQ